MSRNREILCGLFIFLCPAIAAQAQNPFDTFKQFSATIVMSPIPAGREGGGMKVYRSADKVERPCRAAQAT